MNQHKPLKVVFLQAGTSGQPPSRHDELLLIEANIRLFLKSISHYKTIAEISTPEAEADLIRKFSVFLEACRFYPALTDFRNLLKFKSGDKRYRSDGSLSWLHEMIPIINRMALINAGPLNGGIDLKNLEKDGGLGVAISTILGHDQIEDTPITPQQFKFRQTRNAKDLIAIVSKMIPNFYTHAREKWEINNARLVAQNVGQMSSKTVEVNNKGEPVIHADGTWNTLRIFKDVRLFFRNMVEGPKATPTSYISKLLDVCNNMATLTFSKKHDTEKKLSFLNAYENLCGSREHLTLKAMSKWPGHKKEMAHWDNVMGAILYMEFSFLEYVEYAYEGVEAKYQKGDPVEEIAKSGFGAYLDNALSIPRPRFADMIHTYLDDKIKLAQTNPQVRVWLERAILPVLTNHKRHFPELFGSAKNGPRSKTEVTPGYGTPTRAVAAPQFL